jgi:hypothetical protein
MVRVRTVVQLLSGSMITSVWEVVTDSEFDTVRGNISRFVSGDVPVFKCLIQEGGLEQEVYTPARNIDTMMLEMTGDEQSTDSEY